LVRLPALPTALADIALGALATGSVVSRWPVFLLLLLASGCLYSAGMAFNDYFDRDEDARDRPERPIPSGRISPRGAALFASLLLAAGVGFAVLATVVQGVWQPAVQGARQPAVLAVLLAAAILMYDAWLKQTAMGPVGMGLCRFLNVLLGLSVAGPL